MEDETGGDAASGDLGREKLRQGKGGWRSAVRWEADHRNLEGESPGAVSRAVELAHLLLA